MSITRDEAEDLQAALRSEGIDAWLEPGGDVNRGSSDPGVMYEMAAKFTALTSLGRVMWALTDEPDVTNPRWYVMVPEEELNRATRIAERMFPSIRMNR